MHIVPTIFHAHEVSFADVHTKIHQTRFAVEHFHFVVNLLAVVEQICQLFGSQNEVQTLTALRHYKSPSLQHGECPTSIDDDVPIVADNELTPLLKRIIIINIFSSL